MQFRSIRTLALTLTLAVSPLAASAVPQLLDLNAVLPAMRWDTRPEASEWTLAAMTTVAAHDAELAQTVPADITTFCPHYPKASLIQRRAFWVGLLSATAKYESGFNPKAAGGGGRYIGLMQISPRTAQHYDCKAATPATLKDGKANLACAIKIFAPHVASDGMVAGNGNRGIGRDWGPYGSKATRTDIARWTAKQSYCQG